MRVDCHTCVNKYYLECSDIQYKTKEYWRNISNLNILDVKNSLKGVRNTLRKENKLGRKECGMKIANWTFNIGQIVELRIANRQGIA